MNSSALVDESSSNATCDGIDCYPDIVFEMATVLTVVLAVFGAFGNILTVLAILTSRLRNNINSILICNLSVSDLAYCSVVLPLQALTFYSKSWPLSPILCQLHAALRIWMIGVNMMLLSTIALYRFLHVVHPQSHTRYTQTSWFVGACSLCWALPFIFVLTPLVDWWGSFCFQERILQCTFSASSSKSHKIATITAGYVVPCVFICVCYARIGWVVCTTRRRASRGSQYRKQRAKRESFRLTGMMILIFVGFLLGTTPFFAINTIDNKLRYPMPHIWSPFLAWVMYSLNPLIYTIMDANFQRAYHRLLLCLIFKPDNVAETSVVDRQSTLLAGKNENANQ
ncbi:protein trapped in endoderm-1-like [Physella acuta]|uniref:protein trapped in endoderm-1-like n=1 Tax=Physella acuta TaxID=109671 RepID=UPI0027DE64AD|nr:protein trapped in endoderm-1-like [Physella acuta]XP_059150808.1 protein trapped in endoderm-1-like [Physella acuta]XP_059150809.1 protein trapped in endoderm-1-like [Physella acuta]XP_059150810.1 protein trapped in endoderm-1-like [Physella acuta]XP_059150811.1 protein trapped in endoderm-1-like [Physella acuta]